VPRPTASACCATCPYTKEDHPNTTQTTQTTTQTSNQILIEKERDIGLEKIANELLNISLNIDSNKLEMKRVVLVDLKQAMQLAYAFGRNAAAK
jgi:hypothetical protein